MADYFFDSSALTKRYLIETGSPWVEAIAADSTNNIFVASITIVEIASALWRRVRSGGLSSADAASAVSALQTDFSVQYLVNDLSPTVVALAVSLTGKHGLRGYDAVQLAVGIGANRNNLAYGLPPITFVSADTQLNDAARAEGLSVENPNDHP